MDKFLLFLSVGLLPLWISIILVVIGGHQAKNTTDYWNVAPWLIMVSIPVCGITLFAVAFSQLPTVKNSIKNNLSSIFKITSDDNIPKGIKGWSWGAFFLNWIWAIGNRIWIGLLVLIPFPYFGLVMAIILGLKGREWSWKNNEWESVEHFNRVQKQWSFWGILLILGTAAIGILAAIAIPAYQDYVQQKFSSFIINNELYLSIIT